MSTRGLIAIEDANGTCRAIYCHHDMYEEGAGTVLLENYKTKEDVEKLLALGDLSSLDETPEECFAYHRDRGEELSGPYEWKNRHELAKDGWKFCTAEYVYLFVLGEWLVSRCENPQKWLRVEDALKELESADS